MNARRALGALLILVPLAFGAGGASAQNRPIIQIVSPLPTDNTYGLTRFAVEVRSRDLDRVELYVDGRLVKTFKEPPFVAEVELGDDNIAHQYEARAYDMSGASDKVGFQTAAIHVDEEITAELQQLYVTVSLGKQRMLDLEQEDFEVIDDNQRQEIVTFGKGEVPLAATVLIDSSVSMSGERLRSALRGAETFLRAMRPSDQTSVVLFSDRWLQATPFSGDAESLISSLRGVKAAGGTALNDTLYLALKKLEAEQGRRVIILLSDGIDSHSALRMPEVTWLAQRSRALIYWIRTDPRPDDAITLSSAWKDPDTYRAERKELTATVLETGGRVVELANIKNAEAAFTEILSELREQYAFGYYPSKNRGDNSWHKIQVKVRRSELTVRTKNGYIDY